MGANILEEYLGNIRDLGDGTGKVWFTGRHDCFVKLPMGKNILSNIPHEIAGRLQFENIKDYTFHSFRRTAAINFANQGATALQMQSMFGWKNSTIAHGYISKSKRASKEMASKLGSFAL